MALGSSRRAVRLERRETLVSLDFEIDPDVELQTGRAYFQWGLAVIAGHGRLEGSLDCGGALRAALHEGTWGLPGPIR